MKQEQQAALAEAIRLGLPAEIIRVLSYDALALGLARRDTRPVYVAKPNVELFDDPTHNGQYWGEINAGI